MFIICSTENIKRHLYFVLIVNYATCPTYLCNYRDKLAHLHTFTMCTMFIHRGDTLASHFGSHIEKWSNTIFCPHINTIIPRSLLTLHWKGSKFCLSTKNKNYYVQKYKKWYLSNMNTPVVSTLLCNELLINPTCLAPCVCLFSIICLWSYLKLTMYANQISF